MACFSAPAAQDTVRLGDFRGIQISFQMSDMKATIVKDMKAWGSKHINKLRST